jgi:hypothetical protein
MWKILFTIYVKKHHQHNTYTTRLQSFNQRSRQKNGKLIFLVQYADTKESTESRYRRKEGDRRGYATHRNE